MKYVRIVCLAALLAAIMLVGTACLSGNDIEIGEQRCPLDIQELDLSGTVLPEAEELEKLTQLTQLKTLNLQNTGLTVAQYETLAAMLPDCEILWDIPFRGDYIDAGVTELTVTALTEEDLAALRHLPELKRIRGEDCEDLELILRLKEMLPDCELTYQVKVGGQKYSWNTEEMETVDGDTAELMEKLRYLPAMKQVTFTGVIPENESIWELKQAYPQIRFVWEFALFGQTVSSETTELNLSGIPMESVEEVENNLKYFNNLQKVEMCDCGIPSEEMDALWKRHPETRFIWAIQVGNMHLRTDITVLMPFQYGHGHYLPSLRNVDCSEFRYLVDLICLDLGHMFVSDISFVQYMPNLEFLLVCENGITDLSPVAGLQKLKYLEVFYNRELADISALAQCPALEDINLSRCPIADFSPLLELKNVKNLWLYKPYVSAEMEQKLTEAFPEARIVIHETSAIANGWRRLPNYYAQRDLLGMGYMTTST